MKHKTTIYATKQLDATTNKNDDDNLTKKNVNVYSNPHDSFKTFSQFIQSSSELNNLIRTHIESERMTEKTEQNHVETVPLSSNFALIGLHSCGNLSNSMINLYLNNQRADAGDNACTFRKLLCNVACCYNLLNEKYSNDDFKVNKMHLPLDDITQGSKIGADNASKFPMSHYLNKKEYGLTFNIRMLACHSLGRCLDELNSSKEVYTNIFLICSKKAFFIYLFVNCKFLLISPVALGTKLT